MPKFKELEAIANRMAESSSRVGKGMHDLRDLLCLFCCCENYIVIRLIIFILLLLKLFTCCDNYVIVSTMLL
jgi:hypothetical protein